MSDVNVTQIKDTTANPAPLGLFAFGMTTVLLNLHNAGFFGLNSMILAMGIFYGGLAQVTAGAMEWKKNNTFGTVAFSSYGWFWLTLVGLIVLPQINPTWKADDKAMGCYLAVWGLFTLGLFFGTLRLSVALMVVFGSLVILFFGLTIVHYLAFQKSTATEGFESMVGYEGIFCGLSACYTGLAQVLNEVYGKTVLPLGPVKK